MLVRKHYLYNRTDSKFMKNQKQFPVALTDEIKKRLQDESQRTGIPIASLIKMAIQKKFSEEEKKE